MIQGVSMEVHVAASPAELGELAAHDIAAAVRSALREKVNVRMIFAAAPSQSQMLAALLREPGIDWTRITAFHMDEYLDLPCDAPQRFGSWLGREFFHHVPQKAAHLIEPGSDPEAACDAYAALLQEGPIDFVLLGVGTNGHLAFNDPPADLNDPRTVKIVELDRKCREQQVLDGCFRTFEDVPRRAITLTVPTLLAGGELFCSVPGLHKSEAVAAMLHSPISGDCPATALRTHPRCTVYLDRESSSLLGSHSLPSMGADR
jgi:glucosamine-6-phosphate deaminase